MKFPMLHSPLQVRRQSSTGVLIAVQGIIIVLQNNQVESAVNQAVTDANQPYGVSMLISAIQSNSTAAITEFITVFSVAAAGPSKTNVPSTNTSLQLCLPTICVSLLARSCTTTWSSARLFPSLRLVQHRFRRRHQPLNRHLAQPQTQQDCPQQLRRVIRHYSLLRRVLHRILRRLRRHPRQLRLQPRFRLLLLRCALL